MRYGPHLTALTLLMCLVTQRSSGQPFEVNYGGSGQSGTAIGTTTDGGFILGGSSYVEDEAGAGSTDALLVRTDVAGDTLWTRTFGGPGSDFLRDVTQTADGGFMGLGTCNDLGPGGLDVFVIRTNVNGDLVWARAYGGIGDDQGTALVLVPNEGALLVGGAATTSGQRGFAIRIREDGSVIWTRAFGPEMLQGIAGACATRGGGFALVGTALGSIAVAIGMMEIDDSGNTMSNKVVDPGISWANAIAPGVDHGYIVTGSVGADAFLLRMDSLWNMQWMTAYGDAAYIDKGYCVEQLLNGDFVFSGYSYLNTWLVRTNDQGALVWQHRYGVSDFLKDQTQFATLNEDGFAVSSRISDLNGYSAMQLLRTGPDGVLPCHDSSPPIQVWEVSYAVSSPTGTSTSFGSMTEIELSAGAGFAVYHPCLLQGVGSSEDRNAITVFPDPATDELFLKSNVRWQWIDIIDMQGRRLQRIPGNAFQDGKIDLRSCAAGTYLLSCVMQDGSSTTVPFIKE